MCAGGRSRAHALRICPVILTLVNVKNMASLGAHVLFRWSSQGQQRDLIHDKSDQRGDRETHSSSPHRWEQRLEKYPGVSKRVTKRESPGWKWAGDKAEGAGRGKGRRRKKEMCFNPCHTDVCSGKGTKPWPVEGSTLSTVQVIRPRE